MGGARPLTTQPYQPLRQHLDPQPLGERRDEHHPGVRDSTLVVELDLQTVQSDRLVIMHREGDLLNSGGGWPNSRYQALSGDHSSFNTGQNGNGIEGG